MTCPKLDCTRVNGQLEVLGKNEAVRQMLAQARADRRERLRFEALWTKLTRILRRG